MLEGGWVLGKRWTRADGEWPIIMKHLFIVSHGVTAPGFCLEEAAGQRSSAK